MLFCWKGLLSERVFLSYFVGRVYYKWVGVFELFCSKWGVFWYYFVGRDYY